MAFTIPDIANATYQDQAGLDSVDLDIVTAGFARSGMLSGCLVSAQSTPNMTVTIANGRIEVASVTTRVLAVNSLAIGAANVTNPRFDLVVVNSSGVVSITAGTSAAAPVFPAIPASSVVLAAVYIPANATTITANQITDKRLFLQVLDTLQTTYGTTYYFATTGNDSTGTGSFANPYKSLNKAGTILTAGDTAIFADGTYNETTGTNFTTADGTSLKPITVRALNKQLAIFNFTTVGPDAGTKINIAKKYLILDGLEITQNAKGTTSSDHFVGFFAGSDYGVVRNCKIHNSHQNCIKNAQTWGILIEGCTLYDTDQESIDMVNVGMPVIRNNEVYLWGQSSATGGSGNGIFLKGGCRSAQVYGNYFHNSHVCFSAIDLGDSTGGSFAYDSSAAGTPVVAGYENFNSVAFSNIIYSEVAGQIKNGLVIRGGYKCAHTNNVVVGCATGLYTDKGGLIADGWTADTQTRDPIWLNNIIINSTVTGSSFNNEATGSNRYMDFNCFFNNTAAAPTQKHGVTTDPLFVNAASDWHLQSTSPCKDAGTYAIFTGFYGEPMAVSTTYDGYNRSNYGRWDMGAYEYGSP